MPAEVRQAVKGALVVEQCSLCAYTGIGIDGDRSHIEHLLPQTHCQRGEDVAYVNMVACYPAPDAAYVPYGALRKGDWPSRDSLHLFVSPRSAHCEQRFVFNLRGEISAASGGDSAARETIRRLALDDPGLTARRREAIEATLAMRGKGLALLDLRSAKRRLKQIEQAEADASRLEQFCFVLKQALRKHILRLEAIRQSKANKKAP
jgi:uncharacterized protein (TIGR02646 family)